MRDLRPSLSRVRQQLKEMVLTERYEPGDRLPTERILADELGTSRNIVRDALALLEGDGLVTRKAGSGTYVGEINTIWVPSLSSPRDTIEARLIFEPKLARVAASNATREDLELIGATEAKSREALEIEAFEIHGAEMHAAIAAATRNMLLVSMYEQINGARNQAEWGELKRRSSTTTNREVYVEEHAAIVAALLNRDPAGAEEAAAKHVRTVRRHMLED